MQVLILIVQNTSNFEDLGVATSGVTFFRTIGSSFGAAIFGSLFSNFLEAGWVRRWRPAAYRRRRQFAGRRCTDCPMAWPRPS